MRRAMIFSMEALLGLLTALAFLYFLQASPASEISYSTIRQYQLAQDLIEVGVRNDRPMFESWDAQKIEEFYEPLILEAGNYCLELHRLEKNMGGYEDNGQKIPINCEKPAYSTTLKARRLLYKDGFYYVDAYLKQ